MRGVLRSQRKRPKKLCRKIALHSIREKRHDTGRFSKLLGCHYRSTEVQSGTRPDRESLRHKCASRFDSEFIFYFHSEYARQLLLLEKSGDFIDHAWNLIAKTAGLGFNPRFKFTGRATTGVSSQPLSLSP